MGNLLNIRKPMNIAWLIVLLFVFIVNDSYYRDILTLTLLWAGLASAWNISSGLTGQLSIGHAAFIGIGAYTTSILFVNFGVSPWLGILLGGLCSGLFALIIGMATLRLNGPFFALASMAFAEVIRILSISLKDVTGGSSGISTPFQPGFWNMAWASKVDYTLLMFVYAILLFIISSYIKKSKFGFYLVALREDENAAEALGVNTVRFKVAALFLSAFLSGIGGGLYNQYYLYTDPNVVFSINTSVQVALVCIIGGMGTVVGPFLGALLLIPLSILLQGWLTSLHGLYGVIYGITLIIIVLFMPEGLSKKIESLIRSRLRKRKTLTRGEMIEYSKGE